MHGYKRAPSDAVAAAGSSDSSPSSMSTRCPTSIFQTGKALRVKSTKRVVAFRPIDPATAAPCTIQTALDSGASANCFPSTCIGSNHQDVSPTEATKAKVADNRIITASATDESVLPHIPTTSKQTDKCEDKSTPLSSANKLC